MNSRTKMLIAQLSIVFDVKQAHERDKKKNEMRYYMSFT